MANDKLNAFKKLAESKITTEIPLEIQTMITDTAKNEKNGIYYWDFDTAVMIKEMLIEQGYATAETKLFEETFTGDAKAIGDWLETKQPERRQI